MGQDGCSRSSIREERVTYLTVKAIDEVREQLSRFERILESYNIKVLDRWENELEETIELITIAESLPDIRSVRAVAYDCFEDALLTFKSTSGRKEAQGDNLKGFDDEPHNLF